MSITRRQLRKWMFIQWCAAVIGFGAWLGWMAHGIQPVGDEINPNSASDGSFEYLAFLIFRLIPAAGVLCVAITCEWLFYRLYFTDEHS